MLCYAAAAAEGEVCELLAEGLRAYVRDMFNWLDLVTMVVLVVLQGVHLRAIRSDDFDLGPYVGMRWLQAIAALGAWLRLLQCLFIFPTAGPPLLMTLQMLGDLGQFLVLIAFFLVAFTLFPAAVILGSKALEAAGVIKPPAPPGPRS